MIQLFLNNKLIELRGDESISIDYALFSFDDISKRKSARSYSFTIPRTVNNAEVLEISEELNNLTKLPYKKITARLLDNGIDLGIKYAELTGVKDGYEVSLYGTNINFFELIKNKSLTELDLSAYNHTYDFATITGSRSNTSGYIYPIINYGSDASIMGNISREVSWGYLLPAMFLDTVLNQICVDAGYALDNKMLDDSVYTDNPIIIPSIDLKKVNKYNAVFNFDNDCISVIDRFSVTSDVNMLNVTSINTYDANYWSLPYVSLYLPSYYVYGKGLYFEDNITCKYKLTLIIENANSVNVSVDILASDGTTYIDNTQIINTVVVSPGTNTYILEGQFDENYPFFNNVRTILFLPTSNPSVTIKGGSTIEIYESDTVQELYLNATVIAAHTLPDIKQSDLLKDYCQMFGILPQVDEDAKTVTLQRFNAVVDNINSFIDWSDKLDLTEQPEIKFLDDNYGQNNTFSWDVDGDERQPDGTNGSIVVNNENLENEKELVKLNFASTFSDFMLLNIPIPRIGIFENLTYKADKKPRMLILYRKAPNDFSDTSDFVYNGIPSLTLTGSDLIPLCRFIEKEFTYNLGFANSLLTYYNAIQSILTNFKGITCSIRLAASDINKLDFFKPVYIKYFNSYFHINMIRGYKIGSDESTQVELVKLF